MKKEWDWNGSRWWKFDFHTHTPASNDYGKGSNQEALKNRTPREWLLDYMKAGIDCVAITDHNTGKWIDLLKEELERIKSEIDKPKGYRELVLFPSVEISTNGGVHLLAILDTSKSTSDISSLLGAAGFQGEKGSSNAVTNKSFTEVVSEIEKFGGIAIPAHVHKNNGLFEIKGSTLKQALSNKTIFAMEVHHEQESSNSKNLSWTKVLGSDAHHPYGKDGQRYPGSHFTWVKMGKPNIDGLRLALLDGSLDRPFSVLRSDEGINDPNNHTQQAIESIEISQARYLGRSSDFSVCFSPWLNTIIGGRGTGKSTLVEFLRIVLRRENELPEDLKPEFEKYAQVYKDRNGSGLLTNEVEIRAIYRKNGIRYRVQWNPSASIESIEEEIDGNWKTAVGEITQRFPVRIYSQKQILQLAKTPFGLLRIIDEAPEVNCVSLDENREKEETRFLSLRAEIRKIEADLSREPKLQGELDDVKRKLTVFEHAGHAEILINYQKRSRQNREIESWEEGWTGKGKELLDIANDFVPDTLDNSTFDPSSEEDSILLEHATKACEGLKEISKILKDLSLQADRIVSNWKEDVHESLWKMRVNSANEKYFELREKLREENAGDPTAYGELVQRRLIIERQLNDLSSIKGEVTRLRGQAETSLQKLLKIRQELTKSRREFLKNTLKNNTFVKIQIIPYGAKESVEEEFRQLIHREKDGFEKDIWTPNGEGLLNRLYKNGEDTEKIEQNLADLKKRIRRIADKHYDNVADKRFATHISKLPPEAIDRLDFWFPKDSLDVQYSPSGDGEKFRSIQEGSPGQKTATLLAFLLSYGKEPLILDQPEDDLDNHLIYDLIVGQLRGIKRHRQVIVVTHNASIVVNGDAELVVALKPCNGETQKECEGSLQEKAVRKTICDIMEGGRKAFKDRYRRITLEDHRV